MHATSVAPYNKFLWLAIISSLLAATLYLPSLPLLSVLFKTNNLALQSTFSAWLLGATCAQIYPKAWVKKYEDRSLLLFHSVLLSLATLAVILSPNYWFFISARFIQGIAGGGSIVYSLNLLNRSGQNPYENAKQFLRLQALLWMGGGLISIYLLLKLNWQANFYSVLLLSLLTTLGLWRSLTPQSMPNNPPYPKPSLLKNPLFLRYLLSYCFSVASIIALITAAPIVLLNIFHLAPIYFGILQLIAVASYFISAPQAPLLIQKIGITKTLYIGLGCSALSSLALLFLTQLWPLNLSILLICVLGLSFSMGFILPSLTQGLYQTMQNDYPAGQRLINFFSSSSASLSSIAVIYLSAQHFFSYTQVIAITSWISGLIYLLTFKAKETTIKQK